MGAASLALFYAGFATLFVTLGLHSLQLATFASINGVVTSKMEGYSYAGGADPKTLKDISTPGDLHDWLSAVAARVIYQEQEAFQGLAQEESNSSAYATAGSFNRILLVRLTAKRRTLEPNQFGSFRAGGGFNAYPRRLTGGKTMSYASESNYEEKAPLCLPDGQACVEWRKTGSYDEAGGYSMFINPTESGKDDFREALQHWESVGVFDLQLGTFVLDMMLFNLNQDFFVHRSWAFTFDFAGNCAYSNIVRGFSLRSFDDSQPGYVQNYLLRLTLWIMVAFFVLHEVMKLWNLGWQHLRHKGAWIDALSLLLCIIVLLSYRILEGQEIFSQFQFSHLFNADTMVETYEKLADVGKQVEELHVWTAVNLLFVFVRAVVLVAELQSNFGLILEVLDASSSTMTYFLVMFLMIMTGFVLLGYFIFGAGFRSFSNVTRAFFTTFSMLCGEDVFDQLQEVDEPMAYLFYYMFFILFYLVFINVFVSILMAGYDAVTAKLREKDESPITKLLDEVKHECLDRVLAWGRTVGSFLQRSPLVDSLGAIICCCVPTAVSMPNFGRMVSRIRTAIHSDDGDRKVSFHGSKHGTAGQKQQRSQWWEVVCSFALWVNTVMFLTLQVRGASCYQTAQAVVDVPLTAKWTYQDKLEEFESIGNFDEVYGWSTDVFSKLYANNRCARLTSSGTYILGYGDCNNTLDNQHTVQTINSWNLGFMNTTFVRLTIQAACYAAPEDSRWEAGFPLERKTPEIECAEQDCTSVLDKMSCLSFDGAGFQKDANGYFSLGFTGDWYQFSQAKTRLGAHSLTGGFAVSLGMTAEEAQQRLSELHSQAWFTAKAASMVFDWVTYNGNNDLFTYTEVKFSLTPTGEMAKSFKYTTFPMNINSGGGFYAAIRTFILVLFSFYIFMVLTQCLELVSRYQMLRKANPWFKALRLFASEWWNLSDSISLLMAVLTVVYFLMFALLPFTKDFFFEMDSRMRFPIPNDDVVKFGMVRGVDPLRYLEEDWYIFRQFERATQLYNMFLTVSGINNFLIAIKTAKYVGQMKVVQVFSNTLDSGKSRNVYFAVVNLLLMSGFALFFHIIFGKSVDAVRTWPTAIFTLFKWMVGDYDMTPFLKQNEPLAAFFFVTFMTIFYYIATNMFLATMLSVYCDTVGKEDEEKTRQKYRPRKDVMVHYRDKAAMLDDLKPDYFEFREGREKEGKETEVVVGNLPLESQPGAAGVQKGHLLVKINADPKLWKEHCKSINDIFDKLEDGEVHLEFGERQGPPDKGLFRIFNFLKKTVVDVNDGDEVGNTPTCKNFWRRHGAIACISDEVAHLENAEEGDEDGEQEGGLDEEEEQAQEESGSEEEGPGRKPSNAVKNARRRMRTKKRLDALLFSRWSDGKPHRGPDGAVGTGMGWDNFGGTDEGSQPKEVQYEVDHMETFQLKEEMARLSVVGQEAWLDCLVSAIEREMDDDSVVTEVLRTSEMQDLVKNKQSREQKPLQEFYRHADEVLKMLEYKANKKYYQYLQIESEQRQELLRNQNEVLHDYVCELETEFSKVMELIHKNRAKKEVMLTKLAGLLDRTMYRHLDPHSAYNARASISRGGMDDDDDDNNGKRLPAPKIPAITV